VGFPIKKLLMAPKKNNGKEKVHELSKELPMHVDLHSSKKSNNDNDYLLVLLNEPVRGKGGKQAPERTNVGKSFKAREEGIHQKETDKTSKNKLALVDTFLNLHGVLG
jgi:hypothetical protein